LFSGEWLATVGKHNKSMSDRKIQFSHVLAIGGLCASICLGLLIGGGNPLGLIVLSEWVIVLGVTWFALLATYGSYFLYFSGDSLLAMFGKRPPNEKFVEIAKTGSRYALGAGFVGLILGLIVTLAHIDGVVLEVANHIGSSLIGLLLGVILSELWFPFLALTYSAGQEPIHPPNYRRFLFLGLSIPPLLVVAFFAVFVVMTSVQDSEELEPFPATSYLMEDLVVNVAETKGARKLHASFEFQGPPEVIGEMRRRQGQMIDIVSFALAEKRLADLEGVEIRNRLRKEVLSLVNVVLQDGEVTNVYLVKLVVE
jgi:flagellar basal body-associated protein FliL